MVGWQKKKSQASLAWIFPTRISAVHFLAFAFLAITFWFKERVIAGIEDLMSSGSVTNVTGTLFWMRNAFCWSVRTNIFLAFTHSTASWSTHLSMRIAQLGSSFEDFFEPARYLWCSLFFGWVPSPFPLICLSKSFLFGYMLFPSFCSDAPQRHI